MSNLRSTGHLPLKTSMTNKWKSQAPTSELLERQTRALEESLNKLKLAMHPDKTKSTTETNAPIWDKGKTGPLTQYANHVLRDEPRRAFDINKPTKIRVLGDEPPATVVRPSLVANLFSAKPTAATAPKTVKCGQCEKEEAKMKCLECAESYCAGCFAHFHLRGALQRHRCVTLSESRPATPQKKRPTVGADVIFKELRFAQSKDDFLRQSNMATDMYQYNDYEDLESEEGHSSRDGGGQLLNGRYDEKNSAASFQQALMQWRQGGKQKSTKQNNRLKKNSATHEAAVDTTENVHGRLKQVQMPNIEFHSSKLTYGEKLLLKKYRQFFIQRIPNTNRTPREQNNKVTQIQVNRSLPQSINVRETNIEVEALYDDLPTVRAEDSARTITAEDNHNNLDHDDEDEELMRLKQEERSKSRTSIKPISRPNSSRMRKNSTSSRPSSVALFQHPLPSLLSTNPSEELKSIVDPQSRPSSAALKKAVKPDYRLPSIWNRNWKPEQSVFDGIDMKTIKIDENSIAQFDSALVDLLDENKIESASRSDATAVSNETPRPITPRTTIMTGTLEREKPIEPTISGRNSLFTFSGSPRKVESASSKDTGEGGFFTDVTRKTIVPSSPTPPSIIERSTPTPTNRSVRASTEQRSTPTPTNRSVRASIEQRSTPTPTNRSVRASIEQRSAIPNLISLRKASIESLTRAPPKRSITLEETHYQIDDQSRPASSLSSASLPVSIISSKPDLITRPSIERRPKIIPPPQPQVPPAPQPTTAATKKFRVEFSKKSSPPAMPSMVIEGKKVTSARTSVRDSDETVQQSIHSTRNKISSGIQKSSQNILKISSTTSLTSVTRDENILRDESMTINDIPLSKSFNRRSTNIEREPTKARKIEFTVRDGTKWHNASSDTVPSKSVTTSAVRRSIKGTTPRPSTPSNPTNTKLSQQFSAYDNDDGRSSRACQDVDDEECFKQLRVELTSETGTTSPGWNASLSEHVLKNLRAPEVTFTEKDLQDNLAMLEMKLRNELLQRSQTDDDISVHEEIRNL